MHKYFLKDAIGGVSDILGAIYQRRTKAIMIDKSNLRINRINRNQDCARRARLRDSAAKDTRLIPSEAIANPPMRGGSVRESRLIRR